jgi:hypothetical protein
VVTIVNSPEPPTCHDPAKIGRPVADVLDGPSTFQAGASEVLVMLRRYLEMIEEMDLAAGLEPRVRLFLSHRIPGTEVIGLGVPELFMIAEGFQSDDAERLGFQQEDVKVDHHDGRGPVVAQADYLAGLVEIHVGGRLRRRIASEFDGGTRRDAATLAGAIKRDTGEWLAQSVEQFRQPPAAVPTPGVTPEGARRQAAIEATRRLRRSVNPIDYNDQWSRITLFVGRLHSFPLPPLSEEPADIADLPPEMSPAVAASLGLSLEPFEWPSHEPRRTEVAELR